MNFFNYFSLFALLLGGYFVAINISSLDTMVFSFTLQNGSIISLLVSDILIITGVIFTFIEVIKSATISNSAVESSFSILVAVAFLVLFLLYKDTSNKTFLILTLMSFTEAIAGFIIAVNTARRDITIE